MTSSDDQAGPEPTRFGNTYAIIDDYCQVEQANGVLKTECGDASLVEKNGQRYWAIPFTLSGPGAEYPNNTAYIQNKAIKFVIDEQGRRYDSKFEEIDATSQEQANVPPAQTQEPNYISPGDNAGLSPTPETKAEKVAHAQSLIEHAFAAIDREEFSTAAQDYDELSTLLPDKKPELKRQAVEVASALRQMEITHSDADAQHLLVIMRAFAAALNAPTSQPAVDSKTAQQRAIALYPDLAIADSPLNKEFVARYHRYQADNPIYFANPEWPTALAKESVEALNRH